MMKTESDEEYSLLPKERLILLLDEKDREIKRLNTERSQLMLLLGEKEFQLHKRNATVKRNLDKINTESAAIHPEKKTKDEKYWRDFVLSKAEEKLKHEEEEELIMLEEDPRRNKSLSLGEMSDKEVEDTLCGLKEVFDVCKRTPELLVGSNGQVLRDQLKILEAEVEKRKQINSSGKNENRVRLCLNLGLNQD